MDGMPDISFLDAVKAGQTQAVVRWLAQDPALQEAPDAQGMRPLHWAVARGHHATVALLLEAGVEVDPVNAIQARTPLHIAAQKDDAECVRMLLQEGAEALREDGLGERALDKAQTRAVQELLRSYTLDPLFAWRRDLQTGAYRRVWRILRRAPHQIVCADADGQSPLHWAVTAGDVEMTRLLLMTGAAVNARDRQGVTPLLAAVEGGVPDLVALLLAHGADVGVADITSWRALHLAAAGGRVTGGAIFPLRVDEVVTFEPQLWQMSFDFMPAAPEVPDLPSAHGDAHHAILEMLLQAGADPLIPLRGGLTPLHLAAAQGEPARVARLLAAGADPNAASALLHTPLHEAAAAGRGANMDLLLAAGADPAARDYQGRTADDFRRAPSLPVPEAEVVVDAPAFMASDGQGSLF
jgi:ankyrin repeat protein